MTKLYTVTMEYEYVIAVEDDEDPDWVAAECFNEVRHELDTYNVSLHTSEMRSLPEGWDPICYPYNSSDTTEKTISEIIQENESNEISCLQ